MSRRLLITSLAGGAGAGAAAALSVSQAASLLGSATSPAGKVLTDPSPLRKGRFDSGSLEEYLGIYLPELHAQEGDRDDQMIRRAAEIATEAGGGTVLLTAATYRFGAAVALNGLRNVVFESRSGSVVRAAGAVAKLSAFEGGPGVFDADGNPLDHDGASQITLRGLVFEGGLTNGASLDSEPFHDIDGDGARFVNGVGAFARDARKYSPPDATEDQPREGLYKALFISGDRDPGSGTHLTFANIAVEQVRLIGLASLPVHLRGVRGLASVDDSYAYRCLDIGFTYCESVRFNRNRVESSADNGVSISRGNREVLCSTNIITKSWYYGIHLGGFSSDAGSQYVSCTGNTVVHSAEVGINLYDAPADVTITGNHIADVHRGPRGDGGDGQGYAVFIRGIAGASPVPARNIAITGNSFSRAHRAGICIAEHAEGVFVTGNLFFRIGLPSLVDGTPVPFGDGTWNYAVGKPGHDVDVAATVKQIVVTGNAMFEDRDSMLGQKQPRIRATSPGGAGFSVGDNYSNFETLASTIHLPHRASGSAPPAAGTAAYDASTHRMLISDGRSWRDAAGNIVD